ncbi:MAG: LacI family transcriptional regulator [Actinomycetota bacterium]|nr:LacI family transcriptional regulator [Actinomycetota bacterium]
MASERTLPARSLTLEDVARAAGVSRATVSRVVNGTRNVDPELQHVVQQAIEATGYVPNRAARSLVTRRAGSVALAVSTPSQDVCEDPFLGRAFTDPFFGRLLGGALAALRPVGVRLELLLAETDAARDDLVERLGRRDIDGVLLVSMYGADPLPQRLADAGLPAVLLGRPQHEVTIDVVDADHVAGATLAADHLIARGARRIATIAGPADSPAAARRLDGFLAALARHGRRDVPAVRGDFSLHSGEDAMEELLAAHPDVDGVFAANDLMAQGALLVLRERGVAVPERVAVVGYDDSSAATASRPRLTTVRQPLEDMAGEMARLLLERLSAPGGPPTSTVFDPTLVLRRSA